MIIRERAKIEAIWRQDAIPVIYRAGKGEPLKAKFPYKSDNRFWLQNGRRNKPTWLPLKKHWELPKTWFNDTVERTLRRWGKVYIIQPYRENEVCAPACWNAQGHECNCSCMGQNHGSAVHGRWFVVSDSFAIHWHDSELACRLLEISN
jgi:hypothetical protein